MAIFNLESIHELKKVSKRYSGKIELNQQGKNDYVFLVYPTLGAIFVATFVNLDFK